MLRFTGWREPISISGAGKVVDGILRRRPCSFLDPIRTQPPRRPRQQSRQLWQGSDHWHLGRHGSRCLACGLTAASAMRVRDGVQRDGPRAHILSQLAKATAVAMRLRRCPLDLPEHPNEGGSQADDDTQEHQRQGWGCEHVEHSRCDARDVPAESNSSLGADNTGAALIIPGTSSAPNFAACLFADTAISRTPAPAGSASRSG